MTEKAEQKTTEEREWGEWFEQLIRGELKRDSKVEAEGQATRKGIRTWRQQ